MPSPADAGDYLRAQLGVDVLTVTALPGSVANHDYRLDLADGSAVVLKAGPGAEMGAEAWACRTLGDLGVPVPRVVAYEEHGLAGLTTVVLGLVAGGPSEDPSVARAAGRCLRQVHEIDLPGWGGLELGEAHENGPRGAFGSAADALRDQISGVRELVTASILDPGLARAASSCVDHPAILDYTGPGVLLHNDLKPAHLFGAGHRLTAIIDWGDVRVGDPRADLARLSMAGPALTAAFLDGYELRMTNTLADVLARYRIAWNLKALAYEYRAGGDWFDVYRERIVTDVALLAP